MLAEIESKTVDKNKECETLSEVKPVENIR